MDLSKCTIGTDEIDSILKEAKIITDIQVETEDREFLLDDDYTDREITVTVWLEKDWETKVQTYLFIQNYDMETTAETLNEFIELDLWSKNPTINIEINDDDLYYEGDANVEFEEVKKWKNCIKQSKKNSKTQNKQT